MQRHSASQVAPPGGSLAKALRDVGACRICEAQLPLGPRPVVQLGSTARILIVGQAPGRKVHLTGVPWNDASGDRLRDWLGLDRATFFDATKIALLPMGFCYPGVGKSGGDNPPRPECAPYWHERLLSFLPEVQLTMLVGQYAHRHYLDLEGKSSVTETVRAFSKYGPRFFPLPHPSWRSTIWMRKNPWFEADVIPELRKSVQKCC
ncbi:MAG: uracil-DNA glycosylase family protein [Hyphomicrobium sp.]|uniref:uracil-DNA glycosylase family protein n=1 Tax=Hyphomicrobium sp. TaxID=82 RepID=UPI00356AFE69